MINITLEATVCLRPTTCHTNILLVRPYIHIYSHSRNMILTDILLYRFIWTGTKNKHKLVGRHQEADVSPWRCRQQVLQKHYIDFLEQGWRTFLRAHAQTDNKFGRNSLGCPWVYWGKNKVLEPTIITINYLIIIDA